jgi:hypothetical protein
MRKLPVKRCSYVVIKPLLAALLAVGCGDDGPPGSDSTGTETAGDGDGDPGDGDGDGDGDSGDGDGDGDPGDGDGDGDPGDGDGDGDPGPPPGIDCELVSLLGDPIQFDDDIMAERISAAPVIWRTDIDELVIGRSDSPDGNPCTLVVEHRDTDGSLLGAPSLIPLDDQAACSGTAALAYNETLDMYMYAHQGASNNLPRIYLQGFDDAGTDFWHVVGPHVCNSEQQSVAIKAVGDQFYLMGNEHHCSGNGDRRIYVSAWDSTGSMTEMVHTIDGNNGDVACLDATCTAALAVRLGDEPPMDLINGIYATWGRDFDLGAWALGDNKYNMGATTLKKAGVAGNGELYFVATAHGSNNLDYRFRVREPGQLGWLNPGSNTNGGRPSPFEIVWTGSGWLVATAQWPDEGSGTAASWSDYPIRVWHLAPDATLRETFVLDPGESSLLPRMAVMPGKIAITWVRSTDDPSTRHLNFIGC